MSDRVQRTGRVDRTASIVEMRAEAAFRRLRHLLTIPPEQVAQAIAEIPADERPGYLADVNAMLRYPGLDAATRARLQQIKTILSK